MAISIYRKLDDEDIEKIRSMEDRFRIRWNIPDYESGVGWYVHCQALGGDKRMYKAYLKCLARALKVPYSIDLTIANGYIGYYVD